MPLSPGCEYELNQIYTLILDPFYMGPDKFLHRWILFLDCLFIWIHANFGPVVAFECICL